MLVKARMRFPIYASVFRQKQAVKKISKIKKQREIHSNRDNTIPVATLRINYGNKDD